MADVVLTHSYHLANDPKQLRKMQPYAPLGTLYAASSLRSAGLSVAVFDTTMQDPQKLSEMLRRFRPSILVIYEDDFNFLSKMCLSSMRSTAWQMAQIARDAGMSVVAHGSDATDHAEDYLAHGVNYVLTGEAEGTVADLCCRLLAHGHVADVEGVVYSDGAGNVVRNTAIKVRNSSWTTSPAPARELIDLEPYRKAWTSAHGYFSANIVASRGCPYQCNWCAKPISGNKFNIRSAEDVAAEIADLKTLYGVEHLWFGDDIFALNERWVKELASAVGRRACRVPFKIQSRADLMTPGTVTALRNAGCVEVWMGVESGSQKILNAMDKNLRIEEVCEARDLLRAAGIRACYFLQFGYPGEAWEEIQETVAFIRATRPDDVGISVSYPLPGTVFYDRVQEQIGTKRNWKDSDDLCATFTATYNNDFYLTLRDVIHLEVSSWNSQGSISQASVKEGWKRIKRLVATSRNVDATQMPAAETNYLSAFVPLSVLDAAGGRG